MPNVEAASSAGDGNPQDQGPRHGRWLSQHRLGPGPCKWEKHREGDARVLRQEEEAGPCVLPGSLSLPPHPVICAVNEEDEDERGPGHGGGHHLS